MAVWRSMGWICDFPLTLWISQSFVYLKHSNIFHIRSFYKHIELERETQCVERKFQPWQWITSLFVSTNGISVDKRSLFWRITNRWRVDLYATWRIRTKNLIHTAHCTIFFIFLPLIEKIDGRSEKKVKKRFSLQTSSVFL